MVGKYGEYSEIPKMIDLIKKGNEDAPIKFLKEIMTSKNASPEIKENIISDLTRKAEEFPGIKMVVEQFKQIMTSKTVSHYHTYQDVQSPRESPRHNASDKVVDKSQKNVETSKPSSEYARYPADISLSNTPPGGMPLPPAEKQPDEQFKNAVMNLPHYQPHEPTEAEKKRMKEGDYVIYPDKGNKYHFYGMHNKPVTVDFKFNNETQKIKYNLQILNSPHGLSSECDNLEQMFTTITRNAFPYVGLPQSKEEPIGGGKMKQPERAVSPSPARAASPSPARAASPSRARHAAEPEKKVLAEKKQTEHQFIHDVLKHHFIDHEPTAVEKQNMKIVEYVIYQDKGKYHIYGKYHNTPLTIDFSFNKETNEIEYTYSFERMSTLHPLKCNSLKQLFSNMIKDHPRSYAMFNALFKDDVK